jgi:hypothetical protein
MDLQRSSEGRLVKLIQVHSRGVATPPSTKLQSLVWFWGRLALPGAGFDVLLARRAARSWNAPASGEACGMNTATELSFQGTRDRPGVSIPGSNQDRARCSPLWAGVQA